MPEPVLSRTKLVGDGKAQGAIGGFLTPVAPRKRGTGYTELASNPQNEADPPRPWVGCISFHCAGARSTPNREIEVESGSHPKIGPGSLPPVRRKNGGGESDLVAHPELLRVEPPGEVLHGRDE